MLKAVTDSTETTAGLETVSTPPTARAAAAPVKDLNPPFPLSTTWDRLATPRWRARRVIVGVWSLWGAAFTLMVRLLLFRQGREVDRISALFG